MIIKEQETKKKIKAKGILVEITNEGFLIEDEKEGTEDLLVFKDFEMFIGKSITIGVADTEKVDL